MLPEPHIENIRNEPLITKTWNFSKTTPSTFPGGLLVTSANSFIGTHLVSMLQLRWPGPVHLLVRPSTPGEALIKIINAFNKWESGVFHPERFFIHAGDVTLDMLGMKTAEYINLQKKIGFVLHLSMNPMYNLPYSHFKRLWIPELEHMIAFCGNKKQPKSLHYPSSFLANFFITDNDFKHLNQNAWQSGYAGFKWVASRALENAFRQNLNGCLYEIPLVLGTKKRGISPRYYIFWKMFDIFLKTGFYTDFEINIIPVDLLADIIVTNLLADRKGKGQQFLRPGLNQPVTHQDLDHTVAGIIGLKYGELSTLRNHCIDKNNFDYLFPPGLS